MPAGFAYCWANWADDNKFKITQGTLHRAPKTYSALLEECEAACTRMQVPALTPRPGLELCQGDSRLTRDVDPCLHPILLNAPADP